MPNGINSIRKLKVKKAMLEGKPYYQALREAAYEEFKRLRNEKV